MTACILSKLMNLVISKVGGHMMWSVTGGLLTTYSYDLLHDDPVATPRVGLQAQP